MYRVKLVGTGPNNGHQSDIFDNIDQQTAKNQARANYQVKYPNDNLADTVFEVSASN